jgi:hypothetical protein
VQERTVLEAIRSILCNGGSDIWEGIQSDRMEGWLQGSMTDSRTIDPEGLLLTASDAREALGSGVILEIGGSSARVEQLGGVLGAAAVSSAFRSFAGRAIADEDAVPLRVSLMALVFADDGISARTFAQVAKASHLRTKLGGTDVSVETVTAPNGLVSYWSYLSLGRVLVIATLDTLDPARMSMTEFRSLVTKLSEHLERLLER